MTTKEKITLAAIGLGLVAFAWWVSTTSYRKRRAMQASPTVIVIDGCQYLEMATSHDYPVWTHKGNCTNSLHSR